MDQIELQKALDLVKGTAEKHPGANINYNDGRVTAVYEYTIPGYDDFSF